MVTHFMLRTHDGEEVFSDKNILFVTALELIKTGQQRLLLKCAPIYELPSNISTMVKPK